MRWEMGCPSVMFMPGDQGEVRRSSVEELRLRALPQLGTSTSISADSTPWRARRVRPGPSFARSRRPRGATGGSARREPPQLVGLREGGSRQGDGADGEGALVELRQERSVPGTSTTTTAASTRTSEAASGDGPRGRERPVEDSPVRRTGAFARPVLRAPSRTARLYGSSDRGEGRRDGQRPRRATPPARRRRRRRAAAGGGPRLRGGRRGEEHQDDDERGEHDRRADLHGRSETTTSSGPRRSPRAQASSRAGGGTRSRRR